MTTWRELKKDQNIHDVNHGQTLKLSQEWIYQMLKCSDKSWNPKIYPYQQGVNTQKCLNYQSIYFIVNFFVQCSNPENNTTPKFEAKNDHSNMLVVFLTLSNKKKDVIVYSLANSYSLSLQLSWNALKTRSYGSEQLKLFFGFFNAVYCLLL